MRAACTWRWCAWAVACAVNRSVGRGPGIDGALLRTRIALDCRLRLHLAATAIRRGDRRQGALSGYTGFSEADVKEVRGHRITMNNAISLWQVIPTIYDRNWRN